MIPEVPESSRPSPRARPPRRVFVASLSGAPAGALIAIDSREAHHLLEVRRAEAGTAVEAFDASGFCAPATIEISEGRACVRLTGEPALPAKETVEIVVYSALPKGARADWMVEKLSELGVAALVPIITQRSIVEPGLGKLQRLERIAREAAKQSRRHGMLRISPPTTLSEAIEQFAGTRESGAVLLTEVEGKPLPDVSAQQIFIGPEGGWSASEIQEMLGAGLQPARLTQTVLRTETAAIAAATILLARRSEPKAPSA